MSLSKSGSKRKGRQPIVKIDSSDEENNSGKRRRISSPKTESAISNEEENQENAINTTGRSSYSVGSRVWQIHELLAETHNIVPRCALNIVRLFEDENTIPFICRYRRDLVNHMDSDRLRDIKNTYTEIVDLRKKAQRIVDKLEKKSGIKPEVRDEIMAAKTGEELEYLYEPFKTDSKGSLAERAIDLGLEEYADRLLFGNAPPVVLASLVRKDVTDLNTKTKVMNGLCHIISHTISKHPDVLEELRRLRKSHVINLASTLVKKKRATKSKSRASHNGQQHNHKPDALKFENYFDFKYDVRRVKSHQVLAINRGEKLKFLNVKVLIPDSLQHDLRAFVQQRFFDVGIEYAFRQEVLQKSFNECYSKKLEPLLSRQIRSCLTENAKKSSIEVFAKNLKQLLLTSPLKGQRILGIDPGFKNGCKLALISETADVLETGVIYPHVRNADPEECGENLAKLLAKHDCHIIALGNGTACRETEAWISKLYDVNVLDREKIRYTIVSEQGASVYSCSEVAKKEFPKMDVNEISAVSIARRLNDPLSEYTKIEPRNIGVGMYQHDLKDKALTETLKDVVSECVSYVGVDINTASLSLLKHISGLTEKKAEGIIHHRRTKGAFQTRKDLQKVKNIGPKTFIQCAGFIRIEPRSVGGKIKNPLDCTWVHPESYDVAEKIISQCKSKLSDVGTDAFIQKMKEFAAQNDIQKLSATFSMPPERLEIILIALQRKVFEDYRADIDKRPLFKQGITRATELSKGDVVKGVVINVTSFGAFVDIGVEYSGLIATSQMDNTKLSVGDRVNVIVIQTNPERKRIGLRLKNMLIETDTAFVFPSQ